MIKVALTGGIASGKSTVGRLFQEAGIPVIDSDALAHRLTAVGQPGWQAIREHFGPEYFRADGSLDRAALARQVFANPAARERLNRLLHPLIAAAVQEELARLAAAGTPLVVVEVPLLFELGLEKNFDQVIVVLVDEATQRQRLQARDPRSAAEIAGILAAQLPLAAKAARAHWVIDNTGPVSATAAQVKKIIAAWEKQQVPLDKKAEKDYRGNNLP